MAYATLVEKEGINQGFLAVLKPRRIVTGFTLVSGAIYKVSFDYGRVVGCEDDGSALTEAASSALSAGEFFYDTTTEELYVRLSDDSNPSTATMVAVFEVYVTNIQGVHWYRVPTDNTTDFVFYEPLVSKSPVQKSSVSDLLFGYQPVLSGSITLKDPTTSKVFQRIIYDSSFNKASAQLYHTLYQATQGVSVQDLLDTTNTKLIFDGVCSDLSYDDSELRIQFFDRIDTLDTEYRHPSGTSNFYGTTDFPNLDPNKIGSPIRYVYGRVDGFVPVNQDYEADAPTTSTNRVFNVIAEQVNLHELTESVVAGAHTATRTFVNSEVGFSVGDQAFFNRVIGTDEYRKITATGSGFIDHETLSGGAMTSGDSVSRSFVGNITIVQGENIFYPRFNRDYTSSTGLAGGTAGFTFSSSLESNLTTETGVTMNTLAPSDVIFCRVYGRKNDVTLGGPAFGSNDATQGNLTNPAVILFDILKRNAGLAESEINTASFTSLESAVGTEAIGLAIPMTSNESFPSIKDLNLLILKTALIRFFLDNDNKWQVERTGPAGSVDKTVRDDELLEASLRWSYGYKELLSDLVIKYNMQEMSISGEAASDKISKTSTNAKYLHKASKTKTFDSLHFRSTDADNLGNKLKAIFGEREGKLEISVKNRFFSNLINDVITIQRTQIPGFQYDEDTERTRDFVINSTDKSLQEITIELDDQKGIEDNSGDF